MCKDFGSKVNSKSNLSAITQGLNVSSCGLVDRLKRGRERVMGGEKGAREGKGGVERVKVRVSGVRRLKGRAAFSAKRDF